MDLKQQYHLSRYCCAFSDYGSTCGIRLFQSKVQGKVPSADVYITHPCTTTGYNSVTLPRAVILIDTVYNAAFTAWLMSGIFENIPVDLEEAGIIDGCTPIQAFIRIALPLSKPGLVTSALFAFIFSWNDFLFALSLTSPPTATLPLGMLSTFGMLSVGWTYMAAMGVIAVIPVVVVSLLLQRYYVSGLTFGGVK